MLKGGDMAMARVWNRQGTGREALLTWGFSDDDWGNYSAAKTYLTEVAARWPDVKITLFFTG
jgi:hypothetical protein